MEGESIPSAPLHAAALAPVRSHTQGARGPRAQHLASRRPLTRPPPQPPPLPLVCSLQTEYAAISNERQCAFRGSAPPNHGRSQLQGQRVPRGGPLRRGKAPRDEGRKVMVQNMHARPRSFASNKGLGGRPCAQQQEDEGRALRRPPRAVLADVGLGPS